MSDWEPAARNAFKAVHPEIKMYGCWFHYTQRIWAKAQKLGLNQGFRNDFQTTTYISVSQKIEGTPQEVSMCLKMIVKFFSGIYEVI